MQSTHSGQAMNLLNDWASRQNYGAVEQSIESAIERSTWVTCRYYCSATLPAASGSTPAV